MKKYFAAAACAVLGLAVSAPVLAQIAPAPPTDPIPQSARYLASGCANCHGTNGVAKGAMPNLAGMNSRTIERQMTEFREGRRDATVMHQHSKGYAPEQVAAIALFFSRQPKPQ